MVNSTAAAANSNDVLQFVSARPQGHVNVATWIAAGDPGQEDNDDEDEEDDFDDDDDGEDEDEEEEGDEKGDEDSDEEPG